MKILVKITDGKRTYIEDVTETMMEANKDWGLDMSHFRPIQTTPMELDKFNKTDENAHFIYGWVEGFLQSDEVPDWMNYGYRNLKIEVINEF
jgi:hypothetical protein